MASNLRFCTSLAVQALRTARILTQTTSTSFTVVRGKKQWLSKYYRELYNRRVAQGPEPLRARSELQNWNHESEIYAFGKRLGEEFNESTLRRAFTHRSYLEKEESVRAGLGFEGESASLDLEDNELLIQQGRELCEDYIKVYLRNSLQDLPEEGISAIKDHLMSAELLSHVGSNLGVADLLLSEEFPAQESTVSDTLLAVIGALQQDQGSERAAVFVQDFIVTMLVGKDIHTLWKVHNPMGLLKDILNSTARPPPESRLMWETGSETIMAAYMVGIYSDKQLLGKSAGETVTIAEELAAQDALRNIFGLSRASLPFSYGNKGHSLELDEQSQNKSLSQFKA